MIDNFSLGLTHVLMLLVAWRLLYRSDLNTEKPVDDDAKASRWGKGRSKDA